MKRKLINRIRTWVETCSRPIVDRLNAQHDQLAGSLSWLKNEELKNIRKQQKLLIQTILSQRWEQNPDVLQDRREFPFWLNHLGLWGNGAEVGVFEGEFSQTILQNWNGRLLYSIDPWKHFDESDYVDSCNVGNDVHEKRHKLAQARLNAFRGHSEIIRATSRQASGRMSSESLDFVYLDAQHHYEAVVEDIELWYEKVKPGGVIGGHDYLDGRIGESQYGVKQAVDEFSQRTGHQLIITRDGHFPSWFLRKAQ